MQPAPFTGRLSSIYAMMVALSALAMFAVTNLAAPGCSGPPVAACDFLAVGAQAAKANDRGLSPYFETVAYDAGSSVYVTNGPAPPGVLLEPPGVLIDKKSCRVCKVDISRTVLEGTVLARAPALPQPSHQWLTNQ